MYHAFNFEDVLAGPAKAAWQVEDVLPPEAGLGFGCILPGSMKAAPCRSAA